MHVMCYRYVASRSSSRSPSHFRHCVLFHSVWDSGVERKSRLLPSPAAQKGFSLCKNGKDDDDGLPHASGSLLGLKNMLTTHQRCRQNGVLNYLLSLCCRFYEHNHFYFRFLFEEQEQILHRRTKKFCQGDRTD